MINSSKLSVEKATPFTQIVNGDIREAKSGFILSGCNSRNSNGSGLARSLAEKWPRVKERYHSFYADKGYLDLGDFDAVFITNKTPNGRPLYVVNMITQDKFGYDGILYVSYAAIEVGVTNLVRMINRNNLEKSIHTPKIGCGLAGGDWDIVVDIFKRVIPEDFDLTYWDYVG